MIRCCLSKECDWVSLNSFMVFVGFSSMSVEGPTSVFRLAIDLSLKASSSNVFTCVYYYFTLNISNLSFKEEGKLKGKKYVKGKTKQKKAKIKKNG